MSGLTDAEVLRSREEHGSNSLYLRPRRQIGRLLWEVAREPMFLLLVLSCGLYFVLGDTTEAWLMVASIAFVVAIEIVQEWRSENALRALRQFSQPKVRVLRNGASVQVRAEEIVVGDHILFAEGERLAADGLVIEQHDLSVDESILTGESLPVVKTTETGSNLVFQGTVVASGQGMAEITAVGARTGFGRLGKSLESIESEPTPLQRQIDRFVRQMMLAGLLAFLVVLAINYAYTDSIAAALLFSLSFALALIPEEIPVAFTTFMALGAYRLTRRQVLVKQPKTVESLGSATVICLDKTGTITENRMRVAEVADVAGAGRTLEYAMWASEPEPFDPMEKAIHEAYQAQAAPDRRSAFRLAHEYPLGGLPPMMTHVFEDHAQVRIVAAKGAVERLVQVCRLSGEEQTRLLGQAQEMAAKGYRVLAVASAEWSEPAFPREQDDFPWQLQGLVALFDPPKKYIREVLGQFYRAGIRVKMITGDHPGTALNIARECGLSTGDAPPLTGDEVMAMPEETLLATVDKTVVFARMFPDAKLRVIQALKTRGEVVAMTGDGVNDGPALKAAQIGVAMGRRGTEVAKGAASMVLLDDDLRGMVIAVESGRRIYANLRKAVRYILSIHLPIVLIVLLPLVFGWTYLHLLTPIHVIFLELIMDPTCAIAYENEPAEPGLLDRAPRPAGAPLFTQKELWISILQGLMITAGVFAMYAYAIWQGAGESRTRAFVFTTLLLANVFLTLANRSFEQTVRHTLFYKNRLIPWIIGISVLMLGAILFVPALNGLFRLEPLTFGETGICALTAFISVAWFEAWKGLKNGIGRRSTSG